MNWFFQTDIGIYRSENQDNGIFIENKNVALALVCDGMGGHFGGSVASQTVIDLFRYKFTKKPPISVDKIVDWVHEAFENTRKSMEKKAKHDFKLLDMGTTVTCAFFFPKKVIIFNIGDSRTYAFTNKLHQITEDHNLKNYYIKQHGLSPEKASLIPNAAALTSALGPTKDIRVSSYDVKLNNIKYFVLTTDGIHDYITHESFSSIIGTNLPMKKKANKLIKIAIKSGSKDNLTCLIVECN